MRLAKTDRARAALQARDPAISVTEPNVGSDVASVSCRAERTQGGWAITGAKAWCTFAGRADVIARLRAMALGLPARVLNGPPSARAGSLPHFLISVAPDCASLSSIILFSLYQPT